VGLNRLYEPGRYWLGFWREFVEFPTTLRTIEWAEGKSDSSKTKRMPALEFRDQAGTRVFLNLALQYRLKTANIVRMYRGHLLNYENVFAARLQNSLGKVGNDIRIENMWENYQSVAAAFAEVCRKELDKLGVECWGLQVFGARLESKAEDKIVQTQVTKQRQMTQQALKKHAQIRAETRVLIEKYEARARVLHSQGDNNRAIIVREAHALAEANVKSSRGRLLEIVQEEVATPRLRMSDAESMEYQRQILIQSKVKTFASDTSGGGRMRSNAMLAQIQVTSEFDENQCKFPKLANPDEQHRRYSSRGAGLQGSSMIDATTPWIPTLNAGQWVEVQFGVRKVVAGIVTRRPEAWEPAVKTFAVEVRNGSRRWSKVPGEFSASSYDKQSLSLFPSPIVSDSLKIFPLEWHVQVSLRFAVILCYTPQVGDNSNEL